VYRPPYNIINSYNKIFKNFSDFLIILNLNNYLLFVNSKNIKDFLHYSYNIWLIVFVVYNIILKIKNKKIYLKQINYIANLV
jgi:hypothetical protein